MTQARRRRTGVPLHPFLFSLYNEFNMVLLYAFEKHRYISLGNLL